MNLYAIEHPDGGKWWNFRYMRFVKSLSWYCLLPDKGFEEEGAPPGGTVVTFTLTRTPDRAREMLMRAFDDE